MHDVVARAAQTAVSSACVGGHARRRTRSRGRPRAPQRRLERARASGSPSARSRSPRRTRRRAAARTSRSGGSPGSPSRTSGPARAPRGRRGSAKRRAVAHRASASSRSARVTMPAGRPSLGHQQRLAVAGQQLDRLAHRVVGRDGRERRLHHVDDLRRRAARVADGGLSSPRSPTEPTTASGRARRRPGSCETRCSCSSATASRTVWCV